METREMGLLKGPVIASSFARQMEFANLKVWNHIYLKPIRILIRDIEITQNCNFLNRAFPERNWILGENGETCQSVCNKTGRTCNQIEQSKITTSELLKKAMLKAGHICSFHPAAEHRDYPGTPFISSKNNVCTYLTNGSTSVCDSNSYGHHRALCYCSGNYLHLDKFYYLLESNYTNVWLSKVEL